MGAPAAIAGSAILGGLSNYFSARNSNKPTTQTSNERFNRTDSSTLHPWGGTGSLENISRMGDLAMSYGLGAMPYGPSAQQQSIFGDLQGFLGQGPYGVHSSHVSAPQIGPIHGPGSEALDAALERLRTGAGLPSADVTTLGIPTVTMTPEEIASFNPEEDPELKKIYGGHFLGENPYLDDVIEAASDDAIRAYQRGVVPQIDSHFAAAGRFGPGAYANAQAQANEALNRGITDMAMNVRAQDYEAERGRMMQALGLRNEQIVAARNQLTAMRNQDLQAAASLRAQAIQARMSGMIAEAQLLERMAEQAAALAAEKEFMQAQLEMQASMANASNDMQAQALGLQAHQAHVGNLGSLFGMAGALQQEERLGAQLPMSMLANYANIMLPMAAQFGTRETTSSGTSSGRNVMTPPQTNPWVAGLLGGLGGALNGFSMFGGGGGGGGGLGGLMPGAGVLSPAFGGLTQSSPMGPWNPYNGVFGYGSIPGLGVWSPQVMGFGG